MLRAAIFTFAVAATSMADGPRLNTDDLFGPKSDLPQQGIVAEFNSESGQKRLSKIVKLSDQHPIPLIKLFRTYDLNAELDLTKEQTAALLKLESLDIGHMYDSEDLYSGNETEFKEFLADLTARREQYLKTVDQQVAEILRPKQLARLQQLRNHHHFFVYPDASKALHEYRPKDNAEFKVADAVHYRLIRNPPNHERVRRLLSRHFDPKEVERIIGAPSFLEDGAKHRRL